jgi:hypothetical protein
MKWNEIQIADNISSTDGYNDNLKRLGLRQIDNWFG